MITVDFSKRGESSLTEYLYNQLKDRIKAGALHGDEKLPSKRALACHLGISVITVQNAYEQLIAEGYIYSFEKKGYFVTPISPTFLAQETTKKNNMPAVQNKILEAGSNQHSDIVIDLKGNSLNPRQFPFSIWAKLLRQNLSQSKGKILAPLPPQGTEELRVAIAEHLNRFRNMSVDSSQIVVGAGTEYLYSLIVQLLGKDCIYAVENPGYKKTATIIQANGGGCIPIHMDSFGLSPLELELSKTKVVHVSPAHHFPTGIIMPIKRRQELLSWAVRKNGFIIEDDYDSEFRFDGRPLDTLFSTDMNERVIYLNTFTKTISPSLRISYMVLPQHLALEFRKKLGFYSCTVSSIEQLTLAQFIAEGFFEKHLVRMKNYYRNLRDTLVLELDKSPLGKSIAITGKNSGLHFLLNLKTDLSDMELAKQLKKSGIKISFLSEYYHNPGKEHNGTLVVNYSGLRREQIVLAVDSLCKATGSI